MNFSKLFLFTVLVFSCVAIASAGSVTVIGDINGTSSGNNQFYLNVLGSSQTVSFVGSGTSGASQLPGLYNGQPGVSASTSVPINSTNLQNTDLLVIAASSFNVSLNLSQAELDALSGYNGDTLVVLEAQASNTAAIASFNTILEALGTSIRYTGNRIGQSFSGPMEVHPLTAGMGNFSLSAYNTFTGGTTLAFDSSGNSIVMTDGEANGGNPIPEPSTYVALILAFGLFSLRRK